MDKVEFRTLISEVSNAIYTTQLVMEKAQTEKFFSYFESKGEDTVSAICKKIELPYSECGKEKKNVINVPTVSLVPHNPMSLENVEVKIKADLCSYENELMVALERPANLEDNSSECEMAKTGQCEVTLVFQKKEPVDGLKETLGMINKCI